MSAKNEIELVKMKITRDMVGHTCLIPKCYNADYYNKIQPGETIFCHYESLTMNKRRSLEQLGLYWKACQVIADNTEDRNWNTKEKVSNQIKIALKFFNSENIFWFRYTDKNTGETKEMLQFPTRSISFQELDHIEACGFFTEAFDFMSGKIRMEPDEFIEFVKSRMGGA